MERQESSFLRSAALDVPDIDDYLYRLLLPRFASMYKHLSNDKKIDKDLMLTLLQGLGLWKSAAQTPATRALGLRVERTNNRRIVGLIVTLVVLPFIYRRLKTWYEEGNNRVERTNATASAITTEAEEGLEQIGLERRRTIVKTMLECIDSTIPTLRLLVLLSWWSGKGPAPSLPLLLTGLSITTASTTRRAPQNLNVVYAHRRWLYEEMLQTLRVVSPIDSYSDLTGILSSIMKPIREVAKTLVISRRHAAQDGQSSCPICHSSPITIPYVTNCGHVYCYTCLWTARRAQHQAYKCRACRQVVSTAKRAKAG